MRSTMIALVAAMVPAVASAKPNNQTKTDAQSETRVQTDSFEWSTSQDSRLGLMVIGLNPELRTYFGAPRDSGLLVAQVAADSPAARAGVRVGDVITKFGGDKVNSAGDILSSIAKLEGQQKVSIDVMRERKPITLQATLGRAREPSREST